MAVGPLYTTVYGCDCLQYTLVSCLIFHQLSREAENSDIRSTVNIQMYAAATSTTLQMSMVFMCSAVNLSL